MYANNDERGWLERISMNNLSPASILFLVSGTRRFQRWLLDIGFEGENDSAD